MQDLETINKSEGERGVPTDWDEKFLGVLRSAIQTPEVQNEINRKAEIQKQKAELLQKGQKIDQDIASLRQKESAAIALSIDERMSEEVIRRAAMERERIQALTKVKKEIDRRTSEADQNLEIARARIFHSASRIFKLVQIDEQERLDDDLRDIAERLAAWNRALSCVGSEIEAFHAIFYMSENSSLSCRLLLKILKI